MTSPIETIADALISFILSLLRDPEAAEEFTAAPQAALAGHGLQGVCMADVHAVRPIIIDHPSVIHHSDPVPRGGSGEPNVVQEIVRMIQQFTTIDARSTIVDQSVNQSIWTEGGDVTQLFDQEAVIASGDHAVAAGHDVTATDSDVDITVGDVTVGNETNTGSFNGTDVPQPDDSDGTDAPTTGPDDVDGVDAAAGVDAATGADAALPADQPDPAAQAPAPADAPAPASVPEPADLLESDMTAGVSDSYEADAAGTAVDDHPVDAPVDDA